MDMTKIGAFLAQLRKEQNLTQAELGEALGVSNKTVSRWETGSYLPPVEMLQALSERYGVGVGEAIAARIEQGEKLFADECALSEECFGSFWQSLLDALEDEGIIPWEADTEQFFYALACFRSWRGGGPGNDHAFLDNYYALLNAFHDRWEARHPEESEDTSSERSEADQNAEKS